LKSSIRAAVEVEIFSTHQPKAMLVPSRRAIDTNRRFPTMLCVKRPLQDLHINRRLLINARFKGIIAQRISLSVTGRVRQK